MLQNADILLLDEPTNHLGKSLNENLRLTTSVS
jgi:ATPase subunit of ABC transporter with duplicated ATPase domains